MVLTVVGRFRPFITRRVQVIIARFYHEREEKDQNTKNNSEWNIAPFYVL